MQQPILHVITGILGSGKTSVATHLLGATRPEGMPAVVVGEYAEEGLDGHILERTGARVLQVTASGVGDQAKGYVDPVAQLIGEGFHARILLETSGVTEIERVAADLQRDPRTAGRFVFGPTVTVLDAGSFANHSREFPDQLWGQVDVADVVIINKTDKAPDQSLSVMRDEVTARNSTAKVLFSYMGQVRRMEIFDELPEGFTARIAQPRPQPEPPEDFEAFVYRSDKICFDRVMLGHKLLNLPGRIARFKGQLKSWDKTHCVNGMPGQLDWDNTPVKGRTIIAFIGLDLASREAEIRSLLDAELERQQREG